MSKLQMAAMLRVIEDAYEIFGANNNQWQGRHTGAGQRLLANMRDTIAEATGRESIDVQDDYCNRYLSASKP